jgi:sec-independent protein translocase protein TatC
VKVGWLPAMVDIPMALGDHLHDLRRRLIWPVATVAVLFVLTFAFQAQLKRALVWPLERAITIVGPKEAIQVGLIHDQAQFDRLGTEPEHLLVVRSVSEPASNALRISMLASILVAVPVFLWHLWGFVAVGLNARERSLAFLFVPLGVIFFYAGTVAGYFVGMPYMLAWLIQYAASDTTAVYLINQSDYLDEFVSWTLAFGLVMDIPWLVMVVVRVGLITPEKLASYRRYVVFANLVLAACIIPTDVMSMMILAFPMQMLFEGGLFASRFLRPPPRAKAVDGEE